MGSNGKSSSALAKLRVVEVRASGAGLSGSVDHRSISFLQQIGLIRIKQDPYRKNWTIGYPPEHTAFFVEHDGHEEKAGGIFHLIKQVGETRTEVEFGTIILLSSSPSSSYQNCWEVCGSGNALGSWEIITSKKLDIIPFLPVNRIPPSPLARIPAKPFVPVTVPLPKPAPIVSVAPVVRTVITTPPPPPVPSLPVSSIGIASLGQNGNGLVVVRVKVSEVQRFNGQPREEFDPKEIAELADSLVQDTQQSLIIVTPLEGVPGKKWELVDGERRYRGAVLSKTEELLAVVKIFKTKGDQFWASFIANWNRKGHTPIETSRAIAKAIENGKSIKEIVVATGASTEGWVYRHLQLQKLVFELQELMKQSVPKARRLRFGVAIALSKVPDHKDQLRIWEDASKEATPGMVKLRVDELCEAITSKLTLKTRKRKPSDNSERMFRIIRTGETDLVFLRGLKLADFETFVSHRNLGDQTESLSKRAFAVAEKWREFAQKIQDAKK